MRKISWIFILCFPLFAKSQFNIHELGKKEMYFGIALGFNAADSKIIRKPLLSNNDSILGITSKMVAGFNLGIVANWQFNKRFDLRLIPTLSFSDRELDYKIKKAKAIVPQHISSIFLSFPLQVRFKSDPIKDFRIYAIAGVRYDYDLASNKKAKEINLLKSKPHGLSAEYGVGFMIYFPNFIMSPEIKMSHSLLDMNVKNDGFIYSRVIDKLLPRMLTITINLEG